MKKTEEIYNFFDRELSWLEFNSRVLEEAQDIKNPLFERVKFLAIVESNLDEFFMARLITYFELRKRTSSITNSAGLTAKDKLKKISIRVEEMIKDMGNTYSRSLVRSLRKENVNILKMSEIKKEDLEYVRSYFDKVIYPVITPMIVDASRPFPLISNNSLNIAVMINHEKSHLFGTVQVPSVLERILYLPSIDNEKRMILLEDIMKHYINEIFMDHKIVSFGCYRITRNSDIDINEYEEEDLLEAIEESIKQRKWGEVTRVEVEKEMGDSILKWLRDELDVDKDFVFEIGVPLDLKFLFKLKGVAGNDELYYKKFKPYVSKEFENKDMFEVISKKDILLHHPFDSFKHVVDLVWQAGEDSEVLAIKQTLYRVSGKSPIIDALVNAAENGKQVTVLVELKARFDEENNITWAKRLEKSGCHVIYGLLGLKVHGKLLLIVRNEDDGIKRYMHLGTGNYNDVTAKMYTDLSLFTSNPYIGSDASKLFNMLSGYSKIREMNKLSIAPNFLRNKLVSLINREVENANNGIPARIIIKMNGLVDEKMINEFYKASKAGVKVELIVRGMCILKPGIKGLSENITVTSIIGRFLEHTRIYYFYNGGEEQLYLSSADMMTRNLDRRVEILFPIDSPPIASEIMNILEAYRKDNIKARLLCSDGIYRHIDKRGKEQFSAQDYLQEQADIRKIETGVELNNIEEFQPLEG